MRTRRHQIGDRGYFYAPTILTSVRHDMPVFREETFGPLAAVVRVRDADEAVAVANDSPYGLGGNLWTRDVEAGKRLARRIETGGVFINAEQVLGASPRLGKLFESVHLDRARALGSSDAEIAGAVQRMTHDQCATLGVQIQWLNALGFEDVDCFYRFFCFAVFGGWKPA